MIEQASLIVGDGNWAVKSDSLLGYALPQGKYVPREMSVVRATTGTRVNEAGLVEVVPYNLVQYSQEFDNAYWTKYNCTITANNAVAPDGTNSADRLVLTSVSPNAQTLSRQSPIDTTTTTVTFSTFVKYVDKQFIQLVFSGGFSLQFANFDLINGIVTDGTYVSANVQSYANGWYRISITTTGSNTNCLPFIWAIDTALSTRADNSTSTGTSAYLIWGAQIVDGTAPLDYLPTTTRLNIPRIDYSTGSAALLVEPQRTNLCTYSSSFDNAAWITQFATITANDATAPDGTMTADRLNVLTNGYAGVYQSGNSALNKYTSSIFAKKGTKDWLYFVNASGTLVVAWFNISNGTLGTIINGTATIEDFGNGWYRCNYSDASNITNSFFQIGFSDADNSFTPSSNGFAYIWGAQREVGTYPTSYIPTTSAAVTRNADSVSKTGISGLIGQQEGTVFIDVVVNGCDNPFANLVNTEKNTNASFGIVYVKASSQIVAFVNYGVLYVGLSAYGISIGQRAKIALAYKSGNTTLYVNGVQAATDATTFTIPASLDDIFIGDPITYFAYQESITNNATALFKTRLANSELQSLTSL